MPSHRQVAAALSMSVATVSRLRSGERTPGMAGMRKVGEFLNWPVGDQFTLKAEGGTTAWRDEFEKRLREHFAPAEA